jgi:hypothetical protein
VIRTGIAAVLGAVARLATGKEKPAFVEDGITHGDLILSVNVEEHQTKTVRELQPPSAVS